MSKTENKRGETMKIHLIDVGRENFNGTLEVSDKLDADTIAALVLKEARKHLTSVNVSVVVDLKECAGSIYAGFYCVGSVKIEK